jgi:hypothetical protein
MLHTGGVWLMTTLGTRYLAAKVVVSIAAYLVWNYPLNRWFVFAGAGKTCSAGSSCR